jgi:hypothetical protein
MKVRQNLKVQNAINNDDDGDNNYNKPTIATVAKAESVTPQCQNLIPR